MRVRLLRGRAETIESDRNVSDDMLERTAETGLPAFRAWTPHRQVAFGRRDTHEVGYETARRAAESQGFPPVERSVGGRAVAYTGRTVAFVHAVPVEDMRRGLEARYEEAAATVIEALGTLGVEASPGEPPESFCPGAHSIQCGGGNGGNSVPNAAERGAGKVAGIAQRIRREAALVSGCVIVADHEEVAAVLDPVYEALGVPFDPDTVGSVARCGGPSDPEAVIEALESAFVGGRETTVETLNGGSGPA